MLICTSVVPNLTAALVLLPNGLIEPLAEKMFNQLHPAPNFAQLPEPRQDPLLKEYTARIKRLRAQVQELEAAPGDNAAQIAQLKSLIEHMQKGLDRAEKRAKMGSGYMPLVTWDELRGRSDLLPPPRKPPVRD
jgi:hypothetical protein